MIVSQKLVAKFLVKQKTAHDHEIMMLYALASSPLGIVKVISVNKNIIHRLPHIGLRHKFVQNAKYKYSCNISKLCLDQDHFLRKINLVTLNFVRHFQC